MTSFLTLELPKKELGAVVGFLEAEGLSVFRAFLEKVGKWKLVKWVDMKFSALPEK